MFAAEKTRLTTRTANLRFLYGGEKFEPNLDKSKLEEFFKFILFLKITRHFRIAVHLFGNCFVSFLKG